MVKRSAPRARRAKRVGRGMRRGRKAAKGGKRVMNSEFASAKQTILTDNDTTNMLYTLYDINLTQFDRLSQLSQCYQYYRITKIEIKFKPFADTFTNAAANSVPYLLWLIDRNENFDFAANGFQQIRDAGCKPIRFDDKTITVRWKPTVLQTLPSDNFNPPVGTTFMNSRISPWLPTNRYAGQELAPYQWNSSTVPHRGLVYGVQQDIQTSAWQYGTEITVHCQFKKPGMVPPPQGEFQPAKVKQVVAKADPVVVTEEVPTV